MKILFAWEWGAGAGHLRRFVPMFLRLNSSGHHLTIVARELRRLPRLFSSRDDCWIQAPDAGRAMDVVSNACSFADVAYNLGFDNEDNVFAVFAAWQKILRQQRPNLVISDFGVACLWVATAMGIPTVRIGTGYSCPPQGAESTSFLVNSAAPSRTADSILATVTSAMRRLRLDFNPSWNDVLLPPHRTLLASLPTLDPYSEHRTTDEYSGTWDFDGQVQPSWQGLAKHQAVAYLKPFPHLTQLLASLHSLAIETILYGDGISEAMFRQVRNPLLKLCDMPLSLSALPPKCDLMICNGNHGTTATSLAQGLPVLAIPLFLEQRVTAVRIQTEGWGVNLDPRRPEQFRETCLRATSRSLRNSVSRYPSLVSQYANRGVEHAWRKLQAFLD